MVAVEALEKETALRFPEPKETFTHVDPPFVVRRMVPPFPAAMPLFTSINAMPESGLLTPPVTEVHDAPDEVVRRSVPLFPAMKPVDADVNQTLFSA
jgi:hypothetical protein